jgi:cold shock CspA family protein
MAQTQDSFNKKEKEKKRLKKRQDKEAKREERKSNAGGGLDSMIAYVDEFGNLTDLPPDPTKKIKVSLDDIEISVRKKTAEDVDAVHTGKIDFYNLVKGFGFIIEQDTQEKYFVHYTGLEQEVKEGDMVTFELQRGMKGMNAVKVKKA